MKKTVVGISAIVSTIISILLWIWYASIPSFQSTEKSFTDFSEATFQITDKEISQ